ncbi:hypothetical protein J3B02_005652, partial [Coemansia erecta]
RRAHAFARSKEVPAPRVWHLVDGRGGAHCAQGARLGQAGCHQRRRHQALLPPARLRAGRAVHVQEADL